MLERVDADRRGQTKQELLLVAVVAGIALIAMLSVFVPWIRGVWSGIFRAIFG